MKAGTLLKKAFILFLFILTVTGTSCTKNKSNRLKDGTYKGFGDGNNGLVGVEITVKNGEIQEARIIQETESTHFGKPVAQSIIDQFNEKKSTLYIDAESGATRTSEAMINALNDAIAVASGKKEPEPIYTDTSCDIVVIGAGGAGLVAATEAANRGAKVIVLEKMGIVGGNTNSSTGGINAAYTKEQKRLGIKDSKEVFFDDVMKGGKNLNDPELVHTLVDKSADIVEWLQSDLIGADLSDVGIFGGATNKRIHRPMGGAAIGVHLVPLLYRSARTQGAEIRLRHAAKNIIPDESCTKPIGVLVKYDLGQYVINAKAVIIASGGFGANSEMVEKYRPELKNFATTNHRGATGDAFEMVEKFDVALVQMDQIQTHPTVIPESGIMITEAVRGNGAILVGKDGKRFVDEMETRDVVSEAVLAQPGHTAFLVFDQNVRYSLAAIESYAKHGLITSAETPEALAKKINVPTSEMVLTIASYNTFVNERKDRDFGRSPSSMDRTLSKSPYYAIEITPAIHHTMGGIKINSHAQVISNKGKVIPGLFAAGEVTGGVHGGNRLGGNAVADICIFGKIAADSAVDYITTD